MDNNFNNLFIDKSENNKKIKNLIPLYVILLIMVIIIVVYTLYLTLFNIKPKTYFVNIIDETYEKSKIFTSIIDENTKYIQSPVNIDGEFSMNTNIDVIEEYNDYKIKYSAGIDYPNEKFKFMVGLANQEKTLIDVSSFLKDKIGYLKSNTIFNDIIKFEYTDEEIAEKINDIVNVGGNEYDYLIKIFKDSLIESLDDKDFENEVSEITINKKNINTNKITYVLNSEKLNKIGKNIFNKYKTDEKALNILSKVTGISIEDIKLSLNEEWKEIEYNDTITINLYTNKNKILKYEIISTDEYASTKLDITVNEDVYTIITSDENNEEIFKYIITDNKNNKYLFQMYYDNELIATFDIIEFNKYKVQIEYNVKRYNMEFYGSIHMSETKESDTKTVFEDIFDITIKYENTEQKIKFTNKVNEESIKKIEDIDVTNNIDANTISVEYLMDILKNAYTQLKDTPFEELINQMITSNENMKNTYNNEEY